MSAAQTLYARLGGYDAVTAVVDDLLPRLMADPQLARVILGHTGRNISDPPAILFPVFVALLGSAAIRVFFPLFDLLHYQFWIALSQILWICAFTIFLWQYFPMLVQPRVDGRYG